MQLYVFGHGIQYFLDLLTLKKNKPTKERNYFQSALSLPVFVIPSPSPDIFLRYFSSFLTFFLLFFPPSLKKNVDHFLRSIALITCQVQLGDCLVIPFLGLLFCFSHIHIKEGSRCIKRPFLGIQEICFLGIQGSVWGDERTKVIVGFRKWLPISSAQSQRWIKNRISHTGK